MNWNNIHERDMNFEAMYGFDTTIDYLAELEAFNKLTQEQDVEGIKQFAYKHGGRIAFFGKLCYYKELKEAGIF